MDIIWGVDSVLGLKNVTGHKDNTMPIEIRPTNNNIFIIETIELNTRVWDIYSFFPM